MPDDLGHAPLIGRERELAQLRKVLERRRPALVLVTGPASTTSWT
jgi:AAA+ ATPase superfamily predicted ATPase